MVIFVMFLYVASCGTKGVLAVLELCQVREASLCL